VSQAERRLRDAALELGPYGAERQQRSVELALRDVQDLLRSEDTAELELAVSQLQEALFGLNRRLFSERRAEAGPLQGIKNTLGSLRDELFADDDWDEWDRDGRSDPWASSPRRPAAERGESYPYETRYDSRWDAPPSPAFGLGSAGVPAGRDRLDGPARGDWSDAGSAWDNPGSFREIRRDPVSGPPTAWRTGADDEVQRPRTGPDRDGDGDPDGTWSRRSEELSRRPSPQPEPDDPWSNG